MYSFPFFPFPDKNKKKAESAFFVRSGPKYFILKLSSSFYGNRNKFLLPIARAFCTAMMMVVMMNMGDMQ